MKTPIEKAAEAIGKELPIDDVDDDDITILTDIIRRVLSEEVPKMQTYMGMSTLKLSEANAHNKARRDIGLED